MTEFTGERVIPGEVDPDLWNEHFARYAFAARLARGRRVLDVACGTGYGSAELAGIARSVTGIDVSEDAVAYAKSHYGNIDFQVASAESLPFPNQSFDLVVAFEVIEHLEDYRAMVREARRVLTNSGQLIVSTPNKLYYEETRKQSGPNPFHTHEFELEEFREVVTSIFPHVSFFAQNHSDTIIFQPLGKSSATEVRTESAKGRNEESHFFVAVCALLPQLGSPTFVYIPATANVLRERERHIALLEQELATKTEWLNKALSDHEKLVRQHAVQTEELRQRNLWAERLNRDLEQTATRVVAVQDELIAEQKASRETVDLYESKISELHDEVAARTRWAIETEKRLSAELAARCEELAKCVDVLHQTEATLEERTAWAQRLQSEIEQLQGRVSSVVASRWYRMGRTLGMGPELRQS